MDMTFCVLCDFYFISLFDSLALLVGDSFDLCGCELTIDFLLGDLDFPTSKPIVRLLTVVLLNIDNVLGLSDDDLAVLLSHYLSINLFMDDVPF